MINNEEEFKKWFEKMWKRIKDIRPDNITTYKSLYDIMDIFKTGRYLPIENAIRNLMKIDIAIQDRRYEEVRMKLDIVFERLCFFVETETTTKA